MMLKAFCSNTYAIIKRQLWLGALWFAALFFALPVQAAIVLQRVRNGYMAVTVAANDYPANAAQNLLTVFGRQSILLTCLLMLMAFMGALVFGGYMHKQKQVDFYHSQPISRARLLLQNAAAGLLALFIPYVLNLLFTAIVALAMGVGAAFPWGAFFCSLALHTLYFTAIFATALIAVVISGKIAVAGITGIFLLGLLPALLGIALTAAGEFYPTFYRSLYDWSLIIRWLSPAAAYVALSISGPPNGILPIIAYDVLALTAAVALYRRRGSEAAGQAIAFKPARPVLKYAMACLAASGFALVFHSIGNFGGNNYFWLYFGAIVGGFLATQITEIVYAFDFRALLRNLRGLAIFLAAYLVIVTCAINDVSGFNTAVPRADQVASAQIYLPGANNCTRNSYHTYYRYGYHLDEGPWDTELKTLERGERDYLAMGPVTQPQAIAAAVNIAARFANTYPPLRQQPQASEEQRARWAEEGKQYLLDYPREGYDIYPNSTNCRVVFTLKSGRKVARSYNFDIPVQFLLDDIAIIDGQEDFRAAQLRELMYADERYVPERLEVFELFHELSPLNWMTAEDRVNLLAALRADMLELTVEQQRQAMPIGALRMRLYGGPVDYPEFRIWKGNWMDMGNRPYIIQNLPIYASFSRTLDCLANWNTVASFRRTPDSPPKTGIGAELWQPQLDYIESISLRDLYSYRYNKEDYGYASSIYSIYSDYITPCDGVPISITDASIIAEIISRSYPSQVRDFNCFIDFDDRVEVAVNYEGPDGLGFTMWRVFTY